MQFVEDFVNDFLISYINGIDSYLIGLIDFLSVLDKRNFHSLILWYVDDIADVLS